MARISFITPRLEAARRSSQRLRQRADLRARVWKRRAARVLRPFRLDADDRQALAIWTVRALAVLAAASTCGLAVRLFGMTSGLF